MEPDPPLTFDSVWAALKELSEMKDSPSDRDGIILGGVEHITAHEFRDILKSIGGEGGK